MNILKPGTDSVEISAGNFYKHFKLNGSFLCGSGTPRAGGSMKHKGNVAPEVHEK